MPDPIREYSPTDVLAWSRSETPLVRINTSTDALGGLALAMAPVMVNWKQSTPEPGGEYLIHNVNLASNLIEGTTILGSMRVRADSIERVEFVLVVSKVGRLETDAGHAQLRLKRHAQVAEPPLVEQP